MRVRKLLDCWRALSRDERIDFLDALCKLPWLRIRLRASGMRKANRDFTLPSKATTKPVPTDAIGTASKIVAIASVAGTYGLLRATCLAQSTWARRRLSAKGIHSNLVIGVRKRGHELLSHAWIEVDGVTLDPEAPGYVSILSSDKERQREALRSSR